MYETFIHLTPSDPKLKSDAYSRRKLLRYASILSGVSIANVAHANSSHAKHQVLSAKKLIHINLPKGRNDYYPLEMLSISLFEEEQMAHIKLWDINHLEYATYQKDQLSHIRVGGALGIHKVSVHNSLGEKDGY